MNRYEFGDPIMFHLSIPAGPNLHASNTVVDDEIPQKLMTEFPSASVVL